MERGLSVQMLPLSASILSPSHPLVQVMTPGLKALVCLISYFGFFNLFSPYICVPLNILKRTLMIV